MAAGQHDLLSTDWKEYTGGSWRAAGGASMASPTHAPTIAPSSPPVRTCDLSVDVAGFASPQLNGAYVKDPARVMNGRETYWTGEDYRSGRGGAWVMYWCSKYDEWKIGAGSSFSDTSQIGPDQCYGQRAAGQDDLLSADWKEWVWVGTGGLWRAAPDASMTCATSPPSVAPYTPDTPSSSPTSSSPTLAPTSICDRVTASGFQFSDMVGVYTKDATRPMNGVQTFWLGAKNVIYWCSSGSNWYIGTGSDFSDPKKVGPNHCTGYAHGPSGQHDLLRGEWQVWWEGKWVRAPYAAVACAAEAPTAQPFFQDPLLYTPGSPSAAPTRGVVAEAAIDVRVHFRPKVYNASVGSDFDVVSPPAARA
eukprot:gene58075-biopygen78764